MTDDQEERLVLALEMMSMALGSMSKTYELLYYKMYPPKGMVRDADVTHTPTEEEKLRAAQGATGERTTEDWMTLDAERDTEEDMGPRERRFMEKEAQRRAAGETSEDGADDARGESPKTGA